ncbi:MAG: hypothetical protein HY700_14810 [Gemmatimonadetes bacterium]|nr:hypothetical protein [Gemmatimonadota bacterium]
MRKGAPSAVLVSVQDIAARRNVLETLRARQATAIDLLSPPGGDPNNVRALAIVYDFAPWNAEGARTLRRFRLKHPFARILLLVPPTSGIGWINQECNRVPGCDLELQGEGPKGAQSLRSAIDHLLETAPAGQVKLILNLVARSFTERFALFVDQVLAAVLDAGRARTAGHLVSRVARSLGTSTRRLEQICRASRLPSPKELVDSVVLLWLTCVAQLCATTTAGAARQAGISEHRLHRIRERLLPTGTVARRTPREEFYLAFAILAERCGASAAQLSEWILKMG